MVIDKRIDLLENESSELADKLIQVMIGGQYDGGDCDDGDDADDGKEGRSAQERVERTRQQVDTGELVPDGYGDDDDVGKNQGSEMELNFHMIVEK